MSSFKQLSRGGSSYEGTPEQITAGSLQRIADALEIITTDHVKPKKDPDWTGGAVVFPGRYEKPAEEIQHLKNQLRTWKGVANRYKNRLDNLRKMHFEKQAQIHNNA